MKRLFIIILAVLISCGAAFANPESESIVRLDGGFATYGTSKLEASMGIHFGATLVTRHFDFSFNNRFLNIGFKDQYLAQSVLAMHYRYFIPQVPLTVFAGPGLGAAMALFDGDRTGFLGQFDAGAEYAVSQRMAVVGKLYWAYMVFTEGNSRTEIGGAGVEVGMRFAFSDLNPMRY